MKFFLFYLLFILGDTSWAQTLPNEEELKEIMHIASLVSNLEDDEALIESMDKIHQDPVCLPTLETDPAPVTTPMVKKEKPKLSFYFKMTGPVEDMRSSNLNFDKAKHRDSLSGVITAQDETARNQAIASLCGGKSNMEKIEYASTLFNYLGDVYNRDLAGGGNDPFFSSDPTKPSNPQHITLQRQYNALNRLYYGGDSGWPPVAGVCRHATALVSDFLTKCGFSVNEVRQLGYQTDDSGHATVKVVDRQTGKTYFLNWGELKELESPDAFSNFNIPSDSIPGRGMTVVLFSPDEESKPLGLMRTNEGVVMARLLHVADNEVDFTTYQTLEAGTSLDLGKKTKIMASGNWKEIDQKVTLGLIDARNTLTSGEEDTMEGASLSYRRDGVKYFTNNIYWKNRLQTSAGVFQQKMNEVSLLGPVGVEGSGMGFSHIQGMGVGKTFGKDAKTTVELNSDLVAEFYTFSQSTTRPLQDPIKTKNIDGNGYLVTSVRVVHDSPKSLVEARAGSKLTILPDMQMNTEKPKLYVAPFNPQASFIYAYKLPQERKVGASATYVGSFDRQLIRTEAFYTDGKKQFQGSGGFSVIKTVDGNQHVYSIVKLGKDFKINKTNISTAVEAQKSLSANIPVRVEAKVFINLNR